VPRIPDTKRQAITDDIRDGKPRNQIARDHDVSVGSVTNIARESGLTDAFDRSATKKATAANIADHRARLIALASRAAGLAERALGSFERMTDEEWARTSFHSRGIVLGIAADKARELAPDDSGAEGIASLLGDLLGNLKAKHGDAPPE